MIFAELEYPQAYEEIHDALTAYVAEHFAHCEAGLQCDSWVWIFDADEKVAIDTFTAMKHQVKAAAPGPLVQQVIAVLQRRYTVKVFAVPEVEGHEDG